MDKLIYTVCTADYYQHYIPLFVYVARKTGAGVTVDLRGELDDISKECLDIIPPHNIVINENKFLAYPDSVSATNTLRFLTGAQGAQRTLITDVDLMLLTEPFEWHESNLVGGIYTGHRGPTRKPYRPEVNVNGWTGDYERVAGGFFYTTPRWYVQTEDSREAAKQALMDGVIGAYRESDEVTLARLIKGSGLVMPNTVRFDPEIRGLHLGDFKESMRHRWTNASKMKKKFTEKNVRKFLELERDPLWAAMCEVLRADPVITQILANVRVHIHERGVK